MGYCTFGKLKVVCCFGGLVLVFFWGGGVWEMLVAALRFLSGKITPRLMAMWILESPFYKVQKKNQPKKVKLNEAKSNDER